MKHLIHDSSSNSGNSSSQRPFYADGWDYKKPDYHWLINAFSAGLVDRRLDYEFALDYEGGKAVGLMICEEVANKCTHIQVPDWFSVCWAREYMLDPGQCWISDWFHKHQYPWCIIRSSGPEEDWMDGRSGIDTSLDCNCREFDQILRERFKTSGNQVVQEHILGIGCVFDIVYSPIYKRNVIRVAAGGGSRTGDGITWTSATWDNEASMGLWDMENYSWIIPFPENHWLSKSIIVILEELTGAIISMPFYFGLQLELVVKPYRQEVWHLVQLRPSPNPVRGSRVVPKPSGKLVNTSIRVNKAGNISGELVIQGIEDGKEIRNTCNIGWEAEDRLDGGWWEELKQLCTGKIVFWSEQFGLDRYNSPFQVRGVFRMGAAAQLDTRTLFINSAHGTSLPFTEKHKECWEEVRHQGILMGGVSWGIQLQWASRIQKGETIRLNLISDGIVGQIYEE